MNTYKASAGDTTAQVFDGTTGMMAMLSPRHDLMNHSPDGFAWGYGGSGPAQFALAILAHEFNDAFALDHYQDFKNAMIATWEMDEDFILDGNTIRDWSERR